MQCNSSVCNWLRKTLLCVILGASAMVLSGCWLFVAAGAGAGAGYVAGAEASDGDERKDDDDE